MPIYKRCSRCGKRILSGDRCPCQVGHQKERHKAYDQYSRDRRSKEFYSSREWEAARREALEADGGIDVYLYMTENEIVFADTVHHIIPLKKDWGKRTALDNLMSLNHGTHNTVEGLYKADPDKAEFKLRKILKDFRELQRGGGI